MSDDDELLSEMKRMRQEQEERDRRIMASLERRKGQPLPAAQTLRDGYAASDAARQAARDGTELDGGEGE